MKTRLTILLLAAACLTRPLSAMDPVRHTQIRGLFALGRMYDGVAQTEKEIKKDKKEAAWYWLLDDIYRQTGEDSLRLVVLNRALAVKGLRAYEETRMRKAHALFDLGRYREADELLASLKPTRAVRNARAKCALADSLRLHPLAIERTCMSDSINTEWDNLWPGVSADGSTFTSTVVVGKKGWVRSTDDIQEDLYVSHRKADGSWQQTRPLAKPVNTRENEGACSPSADGRYVFFVACNRPDSYGSCDVYYTIRQGNGWSDPIHPGAPLNTRAWESTPFLAASGKELYFSSNREGGVGGQDLWRCDVAMDPAGKLFFGEAVNLGDSINTIFDEISPFLHSDGSTLYFSSNGWPGMGGSDIFIARRSADGRWNRPENIGYPVNTHQNETGFVLAATGETAYLSANGTDGRKQMCIYEIALPEAVRPHPMTTSEGIVMDKQTHRALQARVEVFDTETGELLSTTFSDKTSGRFTAVFPQGRPAGFNISRPGYLPHSRRYSESQHEHEQLYALQPIGEGSAFTLENIYFEFNSSELQTATSGMELDKLVKLLKEHPLIAVEIGGHTDAVGNETYNESLSLKRAQSVADYLRGQGIAPERMTCRGYGASRPIADNTTDEGRARNRRIELTIQKFPSNK